jgi:transposase
VVFVIFAVLVKHVHNMQAIDLTSLGITREGVNATLARVKQKWVRKRLVAILAVLDGKSSAQAARTARTTESSVRRWLRELRQWGLQSLLLDDRHGYPKRKMSPNEVEDARREIEAALKRRPERRMRQRLLAIHAALSGKPVEEAAALAVVRTNTVRDWLHLVRRDGIVQTLERWEKRPSPHTLDADGLELRELAAKEKDLHVRKRMLALACVVDGMSLEDAAASTGLGPCAIRKRMRRFQDEGVAACYDTKPCGRPTRLTVSQLQELRASVLEQPKMNVEELRELIQVRFRVPYSLTGVHLIMKRDLAIVRRRGRVREWAPAAKPGTGQEQDARAGPPVNARKSRGRPRKLIAAQLDELRDHVLRSPPMSYRQLGDLVQALFHVQYSHASLKRLLKEQLGIVCTSPRASWQEV